MMPRIRAISFDLDDTLWEVGPVLQAAEQHCYEWLCQRVPALANHYDIAGLRDLRLQLLHTRTDLRHQITALRRVGIETALQSLGVPDQQAARLAVEAVDIFLDARHAVRFFDGALEVLAALSRDYTLGALTNGNANPNRLGLDSYFSFAFSAEQVNASKPAPAIFQAATSAAGVSPDELLHVGDHVEHDVEAAKDFGARAVWINPAAQPWPGTRYQPDAVIADIRQLPAAIQKLAGTP